jgi:hypothetical protein
LQNFLLLIQLHSTSDNARAFVLPVNDARATQLTAAGPRLWRARIDPRSGRGGGNDYSPKMRTAQQSWPAQVPDLTPLALNGGAPLRFIVSAGPAPATRRASASHNLPYWRLWGLTLGLCQPSTSLLVFHSNVVDGRTKPGQDGNSDRRTESVNLFGAWYNSPNRGRDALPTARQSASIGHDELRPVDPMR